MTDATAETPPPEYSRRPLAGVVITAAAAVVVALMVAAGALVLAARTVDSANATVRTANTRADELAATLDAERVTSSCRSSITSAITDANTDFFAAVGEFLTTLALPQPRDRALILTAVSDIDKSTVRLKAIRDIRVAFEANPTEDCPIPAAPVPETKE